MSVRLSVAEREINLYKKPSSVEREFRGDAMFVILKIHESGALKDLLERGLIPDFKLEIHSEFVSVSQKFINPIVYPFEWSPEQLKAAALTTLEVQKILEGYGLELKDAHPYNIVFDACEAKLVDLGSFQIASSGRNWTAWGEFRSSFLLPLEIARRKHFTVFQNLFIRQGSLLDRKDLLAAYGGPFFLPRKFRGIANKVWTKYFNSYGVDIKRLEKRIPNIILRRMVHFILQMPLPFRKVKMSRLIDKVSRAKFKYGSEWEGYHIQPKLFTGSEEKNSARFEIILDYMSKIRPNSVLELAANEGVLSRSIKIRNPSARVISTDYDIGAVANNFLKTRVSGLAISTMLVDFMGDIFANLDDGRSKRMRSDVVLALAVTHHLVLTQNYTFSAVIKKLKELTKDWVFVEFMPLGLWDGQSAPAYPDYYCEKNFEYEFSREFNIVDRLQLEENRILYVGRIAELEN